MFSNITSITLYQNLVKKEIKFGITNDNKNEGHMKTYENTIKTKCLPRSSRQYAIYKNTQMQKCKINS